MSTKFDEALKSILYDVEVFLTNSLDEVKLTQKLTNEKNSILNKLQELQNEYSQLKTIPPSLPKSRPSIVSTAASFSRPPPPDPTGSTNKAEEEEDDEDGEEYADVDPSSLSRVPSVCTPGVAVLSAGASLTRQSTRTSLSGESEVSGDIQSVTSQVQSQMSALEITGEAAMSGFLTRKTIGKLDLRSMMLGFKSAMLGKQYCVASSGVMYMYDKLNSKKFTDNIALYGYEARPSADQGSKKDYSFELVGPGQRSYAFTADSEEEMNKWINVLNDEALKQPPEARSQTSTGDEVSKSSGPTPSVDDDDDDVYEDTDVVAAAVNAAKPQPEKPDKNLEKQQKEQQKLLQKQQKELEKQQKEQKKLEKQQQKEKEKNLKQQQQQQGRANKPLPARPPSEAHHNADEDDSDGEIYADINPTISVTVAETTSVRSSVSGSHDDVYDDAGHSGSGSIPPPPDRLPAGRDRSPAAPRPPPAGLATRVVPRPIEATQQPEPTQNDNESEDDDNDYENQYYGKWDCKAESGNEISFSCGDIISVVSREYDRFGWWVGRARGGAVGLVPRDYLTPAYQLVKLVTSLFTI